MQQVPVSYWAGLVDGEGCIRIDRSINRKVGRLYHHLRVQISMTDERPLAILHEQFGGCFYKFHNKNPKWKDWRQWGLTSDAAYRFLLLIRPWLIVKAAQADLAIEFQSLIGAKRDHLNGKIVSISPEMVEKREEAFRQMTELNRRGPKDPLDKLANSGKPTEWRSMCLGA